MSVYRSIRSCCVFGTIGLSILLSTKYAEFKAVAHSVQENKCAEKFEICEKAYRANNRGVAQLEQFNPAEAVKEFRKALTINADLKIAQVNLAIALLNAQQVDEARETAEKAVMSAPEILHTHYILGLIARNQNRTDDALAAFERVLASDPTDVGANVNVGQIAAPCSTIACRSR